MLAWSAAVATLVFASAAYAQPNVNGPGPIAVAVGRHAGELVATARTGATGGQPDAPTAVWSEAIRSLLPGMAVRLTLTNGSSVRGLFRDADDQGLTLTVDGVQRRLNRTDVVRLTVSQGTRRKRRETIGLAVGAAIGAWIGLRQCGSQRDNCHEEAMLYFGGPMMAGGLAGHVLPAGTAWRELYRRP